MENDPHRGQPRDLVMCRQCGAPLNVAPEAASVTCAYCHTVNHLEREAAALAPEPTAQAPEDAFARLERLRQELAAHRERAGRPWRTALVVALIFGGFVSLTMVLPVVVTLRGELDMSDAGAWTLGLTCSAIVLVGIGVSSYLGKTKRHRATERELTEQLRATEVELGRAASEPGS